ncbi:hypothetical protein K8F61_12495 [Microbacterium resistens]|uniref:Uncharacterized protein n=1 Tax=Microbacterium resistens TaxID=156977 RepID=A0ABY3RS21_9MICO|nr:hypothetical protein [Microbacterium resistens]UGS25496.1 hypothetical protein K8F61_12495 [Microbacterium resistens]
MSIARAFVALGVALATLVGIVAVAGPANAGQPPAGYPTSEKMDTAGNAQIGNIPIRRGFWDADIDKGWGMDKAWNKHNLWSVAAMKAVLHSSNITPQGTQYLLKAYAGKSYCSGNPQICRVTDRREIRAVVDPKSHKLYHGWPVGGVMGMQTMFCEQQGIWRCPNWVTYSILNPGKHNPYNSFVTDGDLDVPVGEKLRAEQYLLSDEQAEEQAEMMSSPEIVELERQIDSGEVQLLFSFDPLPDEYPAA